MKNTSINTVAFGDKARLADALTAKGAAVRQQVLCAALLPMVSNNAAGYGTFAMLIKDKATRANCPLQQAVANLKGRAKTARDSAFALASVVSTQQEHDDLISQCELAIVSAMTPSAPANPASRIDWKARAETAEAALAACMAERDALTTALSLAGVKAPTFTPVTA